MRGHGHTDEALTPPLVGFLLDLQARRVPGHVAEQIDILLRENAAGVHGKGQAGQLICAGAGRKMPTHAGFSFMVRGKDFSISHTRNTESWRLGAGVEIEDTEPGTPCGSRNEVRSRASEFAESTKQINRSAVEIGLFPLPNVCRPTQLQRTR